MAKNTFTPELNQDLAMLISAAILEAVAGYTVEDSKSVLLGIHSALMIYAKETAAHATKKGMVERLLLSWMVSCDQIDNTCFGEYINLPKDEKKNSGKTTD